MNLGTLAYEERRTALDALGVEVRVFRKGGPDRYVITATIPLGSGDCVRNPTQFRAAHVPSDALPSELAASTPTHTGV